MTRIQQIMALLEERGPMTASEIGEALSMTEKAVTFHVGSYRKHSKGIRIAGFNAYARKRKTRYYAIGTEPDAPRAIRRLPSVEKRIKHPGMTAEQRVEFEHRQRLAMLAAQMKPFRHPQDVAFFGAPL